MQTTIYSCCCRRGSEIGSENVVVAFRSHILHPPSSDRVGAFFVAISQSQSRRRRPRKTRGKLLLQCRRRRANPDVEISLCQRTLRTRRDGKQYRRREETAHGFSTPFRGARISQAVPKVNVMSTFRLARPSPFKVRTCTIYSESTPFFTSVAPSSSYLAASAAKSAAGKYRFA